MITTIWLRELKRPTHTQTLPAIDEDVINMGQS